ncbi:MAG: cell division protein FtsA [Candidatus Nomurabacteria bacterium]|jgi:cell division protein FtsA|nr:cell division protein FtsA [Candidatus Nomurabacteria bacterium]
MQNEKKYAVGVDVGSSSVKVVVGLIKDGESPSIIAAIERAVSGMRKGNIINQNLVAEVLDQALIDAQQMSGTYISTATVNINGAHIAGLQSSGVVSISGAEVTPSDLLRAEETAKIVNLPPNRTILDVLPQNYTLDQHTNIKNPLGMSGVRLEVNAYITTALTPHIDMLVKTLEAANLRPNNIEISGLAAATAALTDQQREHGVVLVDIGAATTNVVVYEEGDLIHAAVIPVGGNNITNDLATVLMVDWDMAEKVKKEQAYAATDQRKGTEVLNIESNNTIVPVDTRKIDMVVEARVEAIFESVNDELKKINRLAKLPGGVVLTGGTAALTGIIENARNTMRLHVKIHIPDKYGGLTDKIMNTKFNTCLGLMLTDAESRPAIEQKKSSAWPKFFAKKAKK